MVFVFTANLWEPFTLYIVHVTHNVGIRVRFELASAETFALSVKFWKVEPNHLQGDIDVIDNNVS